MATLAHLPASPPRAATPPFDQVLCVVGDGDGDPAATEQAIVIAPCAPRLTFVAIADPWHPSVAAFGDRRARQALTSARDRAGTHGVRGDTELLHDGDAAGALISRADDRSLLVAGVPPANTVASLATALAHRATAPLLIARPSRDRGGERPRILVPVDDSPAATEVVRLAGEIPARTGAYVSVVHVRGRDYGSQTRRRLAELSCDLIELTGGEPAVNVLDGRHVAARIAEFARGSRPDLLITGRRGLTALHALGSVSERLMHVAPCSVLVAPTSHGAR